MFEKLNAEFLEVVLQKGECLELCNPALTNSLYKLCQVIIDWVLQRKISIEFRSSHTGCPKKSDYLKFLKTSSQY